MCEWHQGTQKRMFHGMWCHGTGPILSDILEFLYVAVWRWQTLYNDAFLFAARKCQVVAQCNVFSLNALTSSHFKYTDEGFQKQNTAWNVISIIKHLCFFHNPAHPPRKLAHLPSIKNWGPVTGGLTWPWNVILIHNWVFGSVYIFQSHVLYEDRAPTALPYLLLKSFSELKLFWNWLLKKKSA